ncbi:hypothetical protein ANN_17237 [Periplaneta americana]|uniref:Uncharacterized protein n=1 Tax=Periplaneta americana TaxID=6978 RepID=A0ABQ8STS9_PERAM|nr:hypothetical protein ANN_17237 [Periplaneta americana]
MRATAGYTRWDHKNEDIMQELQIEPIMQFISKYQLQWKGHLERMDRCRIPKALFHYHPHGKRSLGRPKKRWTENSSLRPLTLSCLAAFSRAECGNSGYLCGYSCIGPVRIIHDHRFNPTDGADGIREFDADSHNGSAEKVFSLISAQWTKELNRMLTETVGGIIMVKYNFKDMSCEQFHSYLVQDRNLYLETLLHKVYFCHHGMARPQVADRGDGLQIWRVAANVLNKESRTADKGCAPPALKFGEGQPITIKKSLLRNPNNPDV